MHRPCNMTSQVFELRLTGQPSTQSHISFSHEIAALTSTNGTQHCMRLTRLGSPLSSFSSPPTTLTAASTVTIVSIVKMPFAYIAFGSFNRTNEERLSPKLLRTK